MRTLILKRRDFLVNNIADLYSLIRKYRYYYTSLFIADNRREFQKYISDLLYSEFQQILSEQNRTIIFQEEFTKLIITHTDTSETLDVKTQATKYFRRLFLNPTTKQKVENYLTDNIFVKLQIYFNIYYQYLTKVVEVIDKEITTRRTLLSEEPFYIVVNIIFIQEGRLSTY